MCQQLLTLAVARLTVAPPRFRTRATSPAPAPRMVPRAPRNECPPRTNTAPRGPPASGMVSVQADSALEAALDLMVEHHAQVSGQSLDDLADAVLERRIRFG